MGSFEWRRLARPPLSSKAWIGTVDSFQGQEAPISIHSLTASDAENTQ